MKLKFQRGLLVPLGCEGLRVSERPKPARNKNQISNLTTEMETLTKLTFATVVAMTLGATTLFAGPGPVGAPNHPAREYPTVMKKNCERMTVNRNPRLGATAVAACTKEVKGTLECRLACR